MIIEGEGIDPDRMMFDGVDQSKSPTFTMGEVAKLFFGRSTSWLRVKERDGEFVLDGVEIVPSRSETNWRKFVLADIERLAHALASSGAITPHHLMQTLRILKAQGVMSKMIS